MPSPAHGVASFTQKDALAMLTACRFSHLIVNSASLLKKYFVKVWFFIQSSAQILSTGEWLFAYVATTQMKIENIIKSPRKFPGDPFEALLLSSLPARGNHYSDLSHHRLTLRFWTEYKWNYTEHTLLCLGFSVKQCFWVIHVILPVSVYLVHCVNISQLMDIWIIYRF